MIELVRPANPIKPVKKLIDLNKKIKIYYDVIILFY